jgi:two-component system nitrate/nitrite response regulator NarL
MLVEVLADLLEHAGDEVVRIVDAPHVAQASLRQHRPDLVITDEWAPGTDTLVDDLDFALLLLPDQDGVPTVDESRRTAVVAKRTVGLHEVVALVTHIRAIRAGEVSAPRVHSIATAESNGHPRLATFLSARERDVIRELVRGADTATMARRLHISRSTARDHVQRVLTKMDAHSRIQLVSIALRERLVDPTTGLWLLDAGEQSSDGRSHASRRARR